jgi:Tol biopolymer transport system component
MHAQPARSDTPYSSDKPISIPTVFAPNEISSGDYDSHPAFTPDGKTLYFLKLTPDANFWTIVVSHFENGRWIEPEIAPFSGQYSDADPFITADGKRFFFISNRPRTGEETNGKLPKHDIWEMDKTATGWSEPRNLGSPVNSDASEYYPTTAANRTLYFGSRRKGGKGGADIYRAKLVNGEYQEPENLGDAINTGFDEFEPYIAPDESFMIFMAGGGRPDSIGGYDLYISYNRNGQWTKAKNLGEPFNSTADEFSPKFSPDGKYFFWTSARSAIAAPPSTRRTYAELMKQFHSPKNGLGDIYYIDASALKIEK